MSNSRYIPAFVPESHTSRVKNTIDQDAEWIPSDELDFLLDGERFPTKNFVLINGKSSMAVVAEYQGEEFPLYKYPAYLNRAPTSMTDQPAVQFIAKAIEKQVGQHVNHCVINKYRDGKDHIPYHHTDTESIAEGTHIFTVSLGQARIMCIRESRIEKSKKIDLGDGSLYILDCADNLRTEHSIFRKSGERLSLTFRTLSMYGIIKNGIVEVTRSDSEEIMRSKRTITSSFRILG